MPSPTWSPTCWDSSLPTGRRRGSDSATAWRRPSWLCMWWPSSLGARHRINYPFLSRGTGGTASYTPRTASGAGHRAPADQRRTAVGGVAVADRPHRSVRCRGRPHQDIGAGDTGSLHDGPSGAVVTLDQCPVDAVPRARAGAHRPGLLGRDRGDPLKDPLASGCSGDPPGGPIPSKDGRIDRPRAVAEPRRDGHQLTAPADGDPAPSLAGELERERTIPLRSDSPDVIAGDGRDGPKDARHREGRQGHGAPFLPVPSQDQRLLRAEVAAPRRTDGPHRPAGSRHPVQRRTALDHRNGGQVPLDPVPSLDQRKVLDAVRTPPDGPDVL